VPTKDEQAARFRAAFAYANYPGPSKIGQALGKSDATVKKLRNGTGVYTHELWEQVIALTGVPRWFIEHGWEGANVPNEVGLAEKVETLESEMDVVLRILRVRLGRSAVAGTDPPLEHPGDPGDQTGKDPNE
jgi:hypothetical protein